MDYWYLLQILVEAQSLLFSWNFLKRYSKMGFNTSSVWIKVALFCLLLSVLVFVIGFATVSWMTTHGYNWSDSWGLWKRENCPSRRVCTYHKLNKRSLEPLNLEGRQPSQQTHNVAGTSLLRRCNVKTLQRPGDDVVATVCICWARLL